MIFWYISTFFKLLLVQCTLRWSNARTLESPQNGDRGYNYHTLKNFILAFGDKVNVSNFISYHESFLSKVKEGKEKKQPNAIFSLSPLVIAHCNFYFQVWGFKIILAQFLFGRMIGLGGEHWDQINWIDTRTAETCWSFNVIHLSLCWKRI